MTKKEQLLKTAQEAQRAYDNYQEPEKEKRDPKLDGTISAVSDKDGFEWRCQADGASLVRHTVKTLETVFATLHREKSADNALHLMWLALTVLEELNRAKDELES